MNRDLVWPISIIVFFAVAILTFSSYIVFASLQRNDLVSRDYYAREMAYQQRIDSAGRTQALPVRPTVIHDDDQRALLIEFPPALRPGTDHGRLHLYRPANADMDRTLPVALDAEGRYRMDTSGLAAGLWRAQLTWQMDGQDFYLESALVLP